MLEMCIRDSYNRGLAMRKEAFENGSKIGYSQTSAMLTELKKSDDFAFLKAVDSIAQMCIRDSCDTHSKDLEQHPA